MEFLERNNRRRRSGAHARNVAKNARLQLLFVEAVLDEIADADDALQLVVLDDRQMPDPRRRHYREHSVDAIGGPTSEDRVRHQLLDLKAEYGGALPGDRIDEVAL